MLSEATHRALEVRGVVMLEVPEDPKRWCAVCASVQGDLEVRVGEPPRGWRSWKPSAGERWLEENGWTHGVDAWMRGLPAGAGALEVSRIVGAALESALGVPAATPLRQVLVHPGVLPGIAAPPPDAEYADHLTAAFAGLARNRRGSAHIECGVIGSPVSWVFVIEDTLLVEVAAPSLVPEDEYELGNFELSDAGAAEAARRLSDRLVRDFDCSGNMPLFIAIVEDWTPS